MQTLKPLPRHVATLALVAGVASAPAQAGELPKATPPKLPHYHDSGLPLTASVLKTSPLPGTTLVKSTIWNGPKRERSVFYCFYLVRGAPEQVKAASVGPEDVIDMSCTQHYVRTTESLEYWD